MVPCLCGLGAHASELNPDSPVPGFMFLLEGKWPRSQCPWQQEDRRLLQQREELPDTWMQECSGDGSAACRGTECLLLALPLPRSFLRHSQFIYPFVLHLMLAVVQSITASTQRGWQCWWCFVSAGSSPCFVSVLCSRVAGVACCISLQGSTAQVADAFPCLRSRKARAPRMENLASNPDDAGSSCAAEEEEEVGRAPLGTVTEATCCFTPRHHMLSQQEEGCFDQDGELWQETCGRLRPRCCKWGWPHFPFCSWEYLVVGLVEPRRVFWMFSRLWEFSHLGAASFPRGLEAVSFLQLKNVNAIKITGWAL